ncbi:MAG: Ig-like domain-containing protein [Candidatus Omnitrophica bacterium]|nr:Ig-like domain-containing protein [Candidatus Omnitrophota bacterium]
MEQKDKFFLAELIASFLLLNLMALVFAGSLQEFQAYLTVGLLAGFAFSWLTRAKQYPAARIAVNMTAVAACVWILYSVLNSSFYYTEVILIFLKGGIILEVILSFDSCTPASLAYLQALSLPLMMCFPLFIKKYSPLHLVLALAYLVCWGALFKIRFYDSFQPAVFKAAARKYGLIFGLIMFAAAIFTSQVFLRSIKLGTIEKRGILATDGKTIKMKEDTAEKEFYALQEKVQSEVMKLLPDIEKKNRQEVLYQLSSLIKDSQNVLETKKAHQGLVDFFQRPGPGLQHVDTKNLTILMDEYLEKKNEFQLKKAKDNMVAKAKNNPFNIKEKLSLADRANKMLQENSYQKVKQAQREANKITDGSRVSGQVKQEMKDIARHMKTLKAMQTYQAEKKQLSDRPGGTSGKAQELLTQIDKMEKQDDFASLEKSLKEAGDTSDPSEKEAFKALAAMTHLKQEIVLQGKAAELKEKIEQTQVSPETVRQMQELLNAAQDAVKAEALSQSALELQQQARQEQVPLAEELKELMMVKMHLMLKEIKEETKEALKENTLPDKGEELLQQLDRVELRQDPQEALAEIQKIKNQVERIREEGYILARTSETVQDNLTQMQEIFILKSKLETQDYPEARKQEMDYREELRQRIESSKLKEENKETLQQFAESVFKAESLKQLENLSRALKQELEQQVREGEPRQEVQKIEEAFDKAIEIQKMLIADSLLSEIMQKIEELQKTNPEEAEKLKAMVESIRNSASIEEMQEKLAKLQEYLEELKEKLKEQPKEEEKKKSQWEIFILPSRMVAPAGATLSPKVIGIFNRLFLRVLNAELQWSSSDPQVVSVDQRGAIKAVSRGKARITCRYRGEESKGAEVIVTDKTQESLAIAVKKELLR